MVSVSCRMSDSSSYDLFRRYYVEKSNERDTYRPNLTTRIRLAFLRAIHEDGGTAGVKVGPQGLAVVNALFEALQQSVLEADVVRICRVDYNVRFVCEPRDQLAVIERSLYGYDFGVVGTCSFVECVNDGLFTSESLELEGRMRLLQRDEDRTWRSFSWYFKHRGTQTDLRYSRLPR